MDQRMPVSYLRLSSIGGLVPPTSKKIGDRSCDPGTYSPWIRYRPAGSWAENAPRSSLTGWATTRSASGPDAWTIVRWMPSRNMGGQKAPAGSLGADGQVGPAETVPDTTNRCGEKPE